MNGAARDDLLELIDLDQELPGQRRFISCWVGSWRENYFVVDPGPPSTADYLLARLEALHLPRLDLILLTHIHLDHAGAVSRLLERWPEARVYCQRRGRPHLVDPARLWQGSRKVLGHKAEVYGQPGAVPAASLITTADLVEEGVAVVPTPGHAAHHVSFVVGSHLFLGESAGTFSRLGGSGRHLDCYLRPATPPRFFPAVADQSLVNMLSLDPFPAQLNFAHHGCFSGDGRALLTQARQQLVTWLLVLSSELFLAGVDPADTQAVLEMVPNLVPALRKADPFFARGVQLPGDIRQREDDFTRQTLRGMAGHLAAAGSI